MRYIIVGLGNFGSVLAEHFTQMGYDIIGVDKDMERVEALKDTIATAICLNIVNKNTLSVLPLNDTDGVVIALGKNLGDSLSCHAFFKDAGVKNIIMRVTDNIQADILNSLGITDVIFPEYEAASTYILSLRMPNFLSSYRLDDNNYIIEIYPPKRTVGLDAGTINFELDFNVRLIAVKRKVTKSNLIGFHNTEYQVVPSPNNLLLTAEDILVLYGRYADLKELV